MDVKDALVGIQSDRYFFAILVFANIYDVFILIGGLGSLVPERRSFISQYGLKRFIGVLANLTGAAIAGVVLSL